MTVGREYGGRFPRVDSLAVTVVREVLAGVSGHLDSLFAMQGIGSFAVSEGGSDAVRKRWLPAVAALDAIAALALTEPDVGSDLKAITTTVTAEAGHLVVSGRKSFITNAGDADLYTVLCREGDQFSLVLVPADTPGITVSRPHQIIAPHVLGDVVLDGVRVPADHRVGEPGEGFRLTLATLATFRVSVAGAALGVAQAALGEALRHTTGRTSSASRSPGSAPSRHCSRCRGRRSRWRARWPTGPPRPRPVTRRPACTCRRWRRSVPPRWPGGSSTGPSR